MTYSSDAITHIKMGNRAACAFCRLVASSLVCSETGSLNQIFPHPSQKDSHLHFFKNLVQSVLCSLLTSQFVLCSTRLEHQLSRDQNGNGWEQYIVETPTSRPEPSSASGNAPIESALHVPHCCLSDILIVQHR